MTNLSEMFASNSDQNAENTESEQNEDLLFIGEGKKYIDDKAADKAIAFQEDHIKTLEKENNELREKASKSATYDDILNSIKNQNNVETVTGETTTGSQQENVDIDALISKTLEEKLKETSERQVFEENSKLVFEELSKKYGARAGDVYKAKASTLGIDLDELSKTSPKAVLEFFKDPSQSSTSSGYQGGTINTANLTGGNKEEYGTYDYWQKQMKEGRISRDECFKKQHQSLNELGPAKFYSQ